MLNHSRKVIFSIFAIALLGLVSLAYANVSPITTVEINSSTTFGPVLSDDDLFGTSVANIGDLNGDGVSDIAVGAKDDDGGGSSRGAVHIMFMNPDGSGSVLSTVEINDSTTFGPVLSDFDRFGGSVANIGDLNGDGVSDIAVGAPNNDNAFSDSGAIHIMFMNPDGSGDVLSTVEIHDMIPNGPDLFDGDRFGQSIANIGDLNGDGVSDIAVGAPFDDNGGTSRGAIHIMFMNPDGSGSVDSTVEINSSTTFGPVLADFDIFGISVANIGDLNGDGVSDIAVGAFLDDGAGSGRGAVHIMFMNPDGSGAILSTVEINDGTANGPILSDDDSFGTSVANIGDLNGDGVSDIAVGATLDAGAGEFRGAIHIMFMNTNGSVDSTVEINDSTTNGPVLSDDDLFGSSVANIGDLNGDGVSDIAVGAIHDDNGGTNRGAVRIIFLNSITTNGNGSVDSTVEINDSTTFGPVLSDGDLFGDSVANIGDLNGDGVSDIAVGAFFDAGGGSLRGAVHIMFMNTDGSVISTVEINDSTTFGPVLSNGDFFGGSIENIGDLNGDGVSDIAVGAVGDDGAGSSRGAVHIMFMNPDGSGDVLSTVEINDSTTFGPVLSNGDRFGRSIANIGDLNGDGVSDIAVGAGGDAGGGSGRGAVHIMFMNPDGSGDVISTVEINDSTTFGPVLSDSDEFGFSIANIGDLNGDGVSDIAVGADNDAGGGSLRGTVHIIFMNPDGSGAILSTVEINDTTANGPVLSDSDRFGSSIANIGDLNGDGVIDIAVSARFDAGGGSGRGAVHIMFMDPDGSGNVLSTVEINDVTANGPVLSDNDGFGDSVANIGDLNGDGVSDIVVGAGDDDGSGSSRGAVHILFSDKTVIVTDVSSTTSDGTFFTGGVIGITVTFSESVTSTGTPQITLETGTTDRTVDFTSGSPGTTLTFQYTVQSGDVSADLDYVGTSSLALNGGTITATASPNDNAILTLQTPGIFGSLGFNKAIVIDGTVPSCIVPGSGPWTITSSCILTSSTPELDNVLVEINSVLIIQNGVTLNIDFANSNLTVVSGSGVLILAGGSIT